MAGYAFLSHKRKMTLNICKSQLCRKQLMNLETNGFMNDEIIIA